jgi:hypothetical protein
MLPRGSLVLTAILLVSLLTAVDAFAANSKKAGSGIPVAVTASDGAGGTFAGTLLIKEFVRDGDAIRAVGTAVGTLTPASGPVRNIVTQFSAPVALGGSEAATEAFAIQQAACDVLHLVLGPLHLDLLGLVIDLNQVVLDIVAQQGAGNLLGNLLCAITGLLDGGGAVQQVVDLLNQIVGVLG